MFFLVFFCFHIFLMWMVLMVLMSFDNVISDDFNLLIEVIR
ncbi:putative membrane protein [Escherichia coli 6-175-07_S1_C1]|nr:putative membrane protein [Escherichia coli 6-175-07_S1_C1]